MTVPAPTSSDSPRWGSTIKLIVGLTFTALLAVVLVYFRAIIGPLLLAFMLTYLLRPIADRFSALTRLSWRVSTTLIYLCLLVWILAFSIVSGVVVVSQLQSLIGIVQNFIDKDLQNLVSQLSQQVIFVGPFQVDMARLDLGTLTQQLVSEIQPLLGQVTLLVGTIAGETLSILGWLAFILLTSYFLLAESKRVPGHINYQIPGYDVDIRRLVRELGLIWNAFLRGQLILFILVVVSYILLMSVLGIRFSLGIALLAGFARFVPYIGPFVTWTVTALVAFFQAPTYQEQLLNAPPLTYAIIVVVAALVLDQIFDNMVSPQLMGQALKVHPAAVLVGAIIAANLIGVIGLLLAAPVVASLKLIGGYTLRKMLDLDPWQGFDQAQTLELPWVGRAWRRFWVWWRTRRPRPSKERGVIHRG